MTTAAAFSISSPLDAVSLLLRIGSIGVAISSLELLVHRADLGPAGLLEAEVQLTRSAWLVRSRLAPLMGTLSGVGTTVVLLGLRLMAACSLIVAAGNFEVARFGATTVAVVTVLLRLRSSLGIHASGSMVMVTFSASAVGLLVGTDRSLRFALLFIGLEAGLAYLVAGSSKLAEPRWRAGTAIPLIAATVMWGNHREAVFLQAHRSLAKALCWLTMLGECSVPLALVVPVPVGIGLLAAAALFHVGTAVEMRLNSFVWAFGSTFPAILFCASWLHGGHA